MSLSLSITPRDEEWDETVPIFLFSKCDDDDGCRYPQDDDVCVSVGASMDAKRKLCEREEEEEEEEEEHRGEMKYVGRKMSEEIKGEPHPLSAIFDCRDIFETHVLPKLRSVDLVSLIQASQQTSNAVKRSGVRIEWLEIYLVDAIKEQNFESFQFLLDNGCPWGKELARIAKDEGTPYEYLFALYNSKIDDGYLKKSLRPGIEVIAKVLRDQNATVPNIELACTLVVLDLLKSEPDEELVCRVLELNLCDAFQLKAENAKSETITSLSTEIRELLLNCTHKEKKASNKKAVSRSSKQQRRCERRRRRFIPFDDPMSECAQKWPRRSSIYYDLSCRRLLGTRFKHLRPQLSTIAVDEVP